MSSPGKSTSSNSSRPSRHVSTARAFHDYSRTQRGLPPVASRPVGVGDLLVKTYRFIREDGEERSLVENKSEDISASRKDDPVASTSATSRMSTGMPYYFLFTDYPVPSLCSAFKDSPPFLTYFAY